MSGADHDHDPDPDGKDAAAEQLEQQGSEAEQQQEQMQAQAQAQEQEQEQKPEQQLQPEQQQRQPSAQLCESTARASGKRAVASPVVEADPPSAVPATEERLPHLWRTTEELPPWLAAQAGRMPPARQPLDDELLAAAAHDTCTFRADQTAAYHDAHRRELEQNSARRMAEAEQIKARAEEARQQRQAAAEARHRAAAAAIRGARAAESEAKLERAAMRAEEASREEAQKRLRCEEARKRRLRTPGALVRPVGTARLTTKLRTPSPPPHYASPRQNAADHVLRPAPTTSAFVALARATVAAESRTPMAPPSGAVGSAAPPAGCGRRGGAKTASREHVDAKFKLSTADAAGWSTLPPSPRGQVGVLARLLTETTVSAETAATAEVVRMAESTNPTTPTMAGHQQEHGKRLGGSSVTGPSHQLDMAPLSPRTPGLGPWDDPTQTRGGDASGGTTDRRESPVTLARRVCSPRQVNIRPVVAARSSRERQQRFVTGQPANIRKSMAKRETAAAAIAAPAGPSHERSSAFSPRSRGRVSVVSSIGESQVQVQQKHFARSGRRTAHEAGHGSVGVYASAIDMSPWLGDELDASLAVIGF